MNEICSDQNDDEVLQFEVSDVFLELSAGDGRDNTNAVTHVGCAPLWIFVPVLSDRALAPTSI